MRSPLNLLLLLVPVAVVARVQEWSPSLVFGLSALAIVPLASWLGKATEELAARTSAGIGALLNATFGNATELIIALFAVSAGLVDVVKASLAGSIIGNILFVLGLAMVVGGAGREKQLFNRTAASTAASAMTLAVIGLGVPAAFAAAFPQTDRAAPEPLSLYVSVLLIVGYVLSLLFSLHTNAHLYVGHVTEDRGALWSVGQSLGVLAASTIGIAVMSETLVHSVEGATRTLGWSELFIGVMLIPIIGNAAEHLTAVVVARKNQMDLSLGIAMGSSTQIALLVAPFLVFASIPLGHPMDLIFSPVELVAIAASVAIASLVTLDGESHWFEGAQLLIAYGIIGGALFFYP